MIQTRIPKCFDAENAEIEEVTSEVLLFLELLLRCRFDTIDLYMLFSPIASEIKGKEGSEQSKEEGR